MSSIKALFQDHPASVGETYWQHVGVALSFAGRLFFASICCFIHAVLPFTFEKTGSGIVRNLFVRMVTHRSKHPTQDSLGHEWSDYSL